MNAEDGLSRELQTVLDFLSHCLSPVEQWQLHQIQAAQQTYFLPVRSALRKFSGFAKVYICII